MTVTTLRSTVLLAVVITAMLSTVQSSLDDHPDSYWLTVDVLNVEWRKGCLTTAGCAEPRFQVTKVNTVNNEANSISWPVTLKLAEEGTHSFISHWTSQGANDIVLKCEVTGLDPTYGFPRICDATPSKRVFDDENDHLERLRKQQRLTNNGKLVIEVKGKCFNVSLAVQKYDRCPTCVDHHSIAIVEQYTDSEVSNDLLRHFSGNEHFFMAVIILSTFTVILTAGFACLLVAFLQQKRELKTSTSKQRLHSEQLNTVHAIHACQEDARYEIPWEHKARTFRRPTYRNVSSKNDFLPISPSFTGVTVPDVTTALTRPDSQKSPPSLSFGTEPHDDSGLESV
ncbi:unnamed protein product [Thelazia callipaeda]|uniref:Ig-like domain-containing protein n=1 Tax=Thelazia callipaeda TaxID=103827 RepID=A0A0N5DAL4_THECL|nr:unnamed protein product [Thelazia callipaeda]